MKNILLLCMIVAGLAFFVTPLFAEETCYVQSMKAKVMSGPTFKSAIVAEVGKGQKLISSGRVGSWMKVNYDSKTGYISSLLVANHVPLEKAGLIKGKEGDIKQGVRRRASTYTSAAAARGLAADDRRRLSKEEKANYEALADLESLAISDAELSKFIQETR
jgi:uncharacterized protein YgiM (DUF1202 family)